NAFLEQSAMAIVQSAIHVDVRSTRGAWPPLFRFISRARSLIHTPYRTITPAGKCLSSPRCVVILVANVAGVRDLQRIRFAGRYEVKGMAADVYVGDRLLDLRHVAGRALAVRTVRLVMRVGFDRFGVRTILRFWAMARAANIVARCTEERLVFRTVDVVTREARYAARVHQALYEVVTLHAVLVRRAIWEMREGLLAELVLLELPKIPKVLIDVVSDRPVVVLALDRIGHRLTL